MKRIERKWEDRAAKVLKKSAAQFATDPRRALQTFLSGFAQIMVDKLKEKD